MDRGIFHSMTDRARLVLGCAREEARRLGDPALGTRHVLLGMISEAQNTAARILRELIGSLPSWRDLRLRLEAAGQTEEPAAEDAVASPYGRALTAAALEASRLGSPRVGTEHLLEPVFGREDEIDSAIEVLIRRSKNHVLLAGEPGTGRKAIARGVA